MTRASKPIPEGFHSVTPSLILRNAAQAIDFYKRALGAQERMRMAGPDGKGIMHAELKIGDSIIFISDESPQSSAKSPQTLGGSTTVLNLYVPDVNLGSGRIRSDPSTAASCTRCSSPSCLMTRYRR